MEYAIVRNFNTNCDFLLDFLTIGIFLTNLIQKSSVGASRLSITRKLQSENRYEELREYFIAICIFTTFELVFPKHVVNFCLFPIECIKMQKNLNIEKIWIVGENPSPIDQKFLLYHRVKVGTSPNFGRYLMILQTMSY